MKELEILKEKVKLSNQLLNNLKEIEKIGSLDKKRSWEKIYFTLLDNDELNSAQLRLITGYGETRISAIRDDIREYAISIGEELETRSVPTELFLKHQGKTMNYYKNKCEIEIKMKLLKKGEA